MTASKQPKNAGAWTVQSALSECSKYPVERFTLVAHLESGERQIYEIPHHQSNCPTPDLGAQATYSGSAPHQYEYQNVYQRDFQNKRRTPADFDNDDGNSRNDYRSRGRSLPCLVIGGKALGETQIITIGNEQEVEQFYITRFKDFQQAGCKIGGRTFVKLLEPKKQTHYPYTNRDNPPPWWPGDLRHKEPDHLYKWERVRLLIHILRLVVQPYQLQHPTVQKHGLNIQKLEETTMKALSSWFEDPASPKNLQKKPYLEEIFKVARAEEQYKRGEISSNMQITIMYGDRSSVEDDTDASTEQGDDNDDDVVIPRALPSIPTPSSSSSQHTGDVGRPRVARELDTTTSFAEPAYPYQMYRPTVPEISEHSLHGIGFQQSQTLGSAGLPSSYSWPKTTMGNNETMNSHQYLVPHPTTMASHPTTMAPQSDRVSFPMTAMTQSPSSWMAHPYPPESQSHSPYGTL